ncbi:MAG TPA: ATP-binding cassette domain-containing protein [Plantibacter sp.]|uniref:ABC transporter ATP-binding protein n=1 Tax=unclassified Plantibacter TaxID=2624265 RepID=UPI002C565395|nr:ATP-binding cassette domain-containing protein [Plantibacter sp.]
MVSVAPTGPARVVVDDWGWRHAGRKAWAVHDLDLVIEPGERVLLLGASGAGKSTLIHALAGVLGGADEGESHGSLLVDGARPEQARGRIGLVLQDPDSQVILSKVGDDVAFGCENLGVPRDEIWRRVGAALDAVGLDLPLHHPTSALSGGQKQRLALAGVLAMQPSLLLLDEPTANLDPEGVVEVRDAVARLTADDSSTLIVIEHRVEVWRDLMTRVIVLDADGGVLADGPPDRVLDDVGERLAAAGVWVPGIPLGLPARVAPPVHELALTTEALTIGRHRAHPVQQGLGIGVPSGSATVIVGPNGAGKSTLALTLAGLLPELAGRVAASPTLAGSLGARPIRWRSTELLTRIGTVFQDPEHQFVASTARAELAVALQALRWSRGAIDERVSEILEALGLGALAEANPFSLSGGQKRRLSVATVLAARPAVLVLDEPTFGQDRRTWLSLVGLLRDELERGATIVSVTHDAGVIEYLGDHRIVLERSAEAVQAA